MPLPSLTLALLAGLTPQGADPALRPAPGLEARVVLAPGALADPIDLAWDPSGHLFVLEAGGDVERVGSMLVPFAHGLEGATGILYWGEGLLVARPGGVDRVLDPNADLLVPWRSELVSLARDETLSSLTPGPDGRVWAVRHVAAADAAEREGIVRFEPREGAEVELVARVQGARSVVVRGDGEVLVATRNAHLLELVVPEGAFPAGRIGDAPALFSIADHADPAAPGSREDRAAGGSEWLGAAFGDAFAGARVVCVPLAGIVHADALLGAGVHPAGTRVAAGELLGSRAPGFRPLTARLGPLRELWVLDGGDGERGARLVTLRPEGGPTLAVLDGEPDDAASDLLSFEDSALLDTLVAGDPFLRRQAWRVLLARGLDAAGRAELLARARADANPALWLPALWLTRDGDLGREALRAFDPRVRRAALRIALEDEEFATAFYPAEVAARTHDPDGRVRLLALLVLAKKPIALSPRDVPDAFRKAEDDWTRSALLTLAMRRPEELLAAIVRGGDETGLAPLVTAMSADVGRRGDLGAAVHMVLELRGAESIPHLAGLVLRRLSERFAAETPWPSPRLALVLRHLAEHERLSLAAAAFPLAVGWLGPRAGTKEVERWTARLRAVVTDEERSLETRLACLASLLAVPSTRDAARALAADHRGEPAWDRVLGE